MHPTECIAPSKTLEIDALAKKLLSEGKDVINFTVGEPDFPTPKNIVDKAIEALQKGLQNTQTVTVYLNYGKRYRNT